MTDLTTLPFPPGSPHFTKNSDGEAIFIGACNGFRLSSIRGRHNRTIVCNVGEAVWRRRAEAVEREVMADEDDVNDFDEFHARYREFEKSIEAAAAWVAASLEQE